MSRRQHPVSLSAAALAGIAALALPDRAGRRHPARPRPGGRDHLARQPGSAGRGGVAQPGEGRHPRGARRRLPAGELRLVVGAVAQPLVPQQSRLRGDPRPVPGRQFRALDPGAHPGGDRGQAAGLDLRQDPRRDRSRRDRRRIRRRADPHRPARRRVLDRRGLLPRPGSARGSGDDRGRARVPQPRSGAHRGSARDRRDDPTRAAPRALRARRRRPRSRPPARPGDGRRDAPAATPRPAAGRAARARTLFRHAAGSASDRLARPGGGGTARDRGPPASGGRLQGPAADHPRRRPAAHRPQRLLGTRGASGRRT